MTVMDTPHVIGGRKCQVKTPMSKVDARDARQENVRLFIGRLGDKITTKKLREFFLTEARNVDPHVQIVDVFIPQPFRAFAFVTLSSTAVAKELLKKDDFVIDGAPIALSIAAPKQHVFSSPPYASAGGVVGGGGGGAYGRRGYYEQQQQPNARLAMPDPWEHPDHARYERYMDTYEAGRYDTRSPLPSGSNALATNLETLNLNNMQPEVMNAAWKAFWSVAQEPAGVPMNQPVLMPRSNRMAPHMARSAAYSNVASSSSSQQHHPSTSRHRPAHGSPSWR